MTLDLAARADLHPGLNLGKGTDPRLAADRRLVEVGERRDDDSLPEPAVPDQATGSLVGGGVEHAGTIAAADRGEHLRATIAALERWGRERDWVGPDPYEGLNARRAGLLRRSPLGRRLLIQAVKRSPLDLRRPLGISPEVDAATLAHVLRAYARLPTELASAGPGAAAAAERLLGLRTDAGGWSSWGYHFDVETRFFFYGRGTPNTIATAFAGHALLDAHAELGDDRLLDAARGAGRFFLEGVGLNEGPGGAYFGYFPGDATPIHNASMLAASFCARLGAALPPEERGEFVAAARSAVGYALDHQRDDGSWPYAEGGRGDWVDGFHTGYVLDALGGCAAALDDADAAAARERGLAFYRDRLLAPDGTPRYFVGATLPIDGQSAAQAIRSFALAGIGDERWLELAWRAYGYAIRRLRRPDGAFVFQRRRLWTNRTPHVRWVQAPMLEALSLLLAVAERGAGTR